MWVKNVFSSIHQKPFCMLKQNNLKKKRFEKNYFNLYSHFGLKKKSQFYHSISNP